MVRLGLGLMLRLSNPWLTCGRIRVRVRVRFRISIRIRFVFRIRLG